MAIAAGVFVWTASTTAEPTFTVMRREQALQPSTPPRDRSDGKPSAALRGRVLAADSGAPLRKAQVRLISPTLRENRLTSTDAAGKYEFTHLRAGQYTLLAMKGSYVPLQFGQTRPFVPGTPVTVADGQVLERIDLALPRGGMVNGTISDEFSEPVTDALVMALRSAYIAGRRRMITVGRVGLTNELGHFHLFGLPPGEYYISATLSSGADYGETTDRSGYAPTYYPGTPDIAAAQRITVGFGQQLAEVGFPLSSIPTAQLAGTAYDSDGRPLGGGGVTLISTVGGLALAAATSQIKSDGAFALPNVAPGEYMLQAASGAAVASTDIEAASMPITVSGADIFGIRLAAEKPAVVSGAVVVPTTENALSPSAVQLQIVSARPGDELVSNGSIGLVNQDWTFQMRARPGPSMLRLAGIAPGWSVKAVMLDGTDVTDTGFDLETRQELRGLTVVLTNQPSQITGVVLDSHGRPAGEYSVVVFPMDSMHWGFRSRYLASARPNQDGRFTVRALPPGEYLVAAVAYVEQGESSDPQFLEAIRFKARPLTLAEGESKTVRLDLTDR
jgi:protocatechuate 3,4-dioxygenase beta subunit